jgi:hypothetical protein
MEEVDDAYLLSYIKDVDFYEMKIMKDIQIQKKKEILIIKKMKFCTQFIQN